MNPREFTGGEVVSIDCWGFLPGIFRLLDRRLGEFLDRSESDTRTEFQLPAAVADLISTHELSVPVLRTNVDWFGVTYREDRPFDQPSSSGP